MSGYTATLKMLASGVDPDLSITVPETSITYVWSCKNLNTKGACLNQAGKLIPTPP
jgi:hypothetical protein